MLPFEEVEREVVVNDVTKNIGKDSDNILDESENIKESTILTEELSVPLQLD